MFIRILATASFTILLGGIALAWPPQPTASGRLDHAALRAFEQALAKGDAPKTTSAIIVLNGDLAYEKYWNEGGPDVANDTRSATKSLTAMALGLAIADRKIRTVDEPAFAYLRDLEPFANDTPAKRAIKIADLLTMSSALDCDDNNDTPGNEENMYPKESWARFTVDLPLKQGWTRDATGRGPWAYCTAGTFLLGQIIQRATGERIDRYVEKRVLKPLGVTTHRWDASPSGEIQTGGGLELTSRDLAKLAWMMTDTGRFQGRQILAKEWVRDMLTVRRDAFADMKYGYQYWQRSYPSKCGPVEAWFMAGNGGNHILSIPSLKAAVLITRTAYNTRGMHQQTIAALEKFLIPALPCSTR
jgi:CubicO group peptidase (beta-lactamase class C family)